MKSTNTIKRTALPVIGAKLGGGFYTGILSIDGVLHAVIVAPKSGGEHADAPWGDYGKLIKGADSYANGLANTKAMAKAGCKIADWALALRIGGFKDWAIPARDQLELIYRNLKPTTDKNYCYFRSGDNPSTGTYPYTELLPKQTKVKAFKSGGVESFDAVWYWASTQYSVNCAWCQHFGIGNQDGLVKDGNGRVRAVRTVSISN